MVMPDVLIVENYRTMGALGLKDTILAIGLPYMASAFGIFLLRQTFKTVPRELDEAARMEGCSAAAGAVEGLRAAGAAGVSRLRAGVSVSYHWNNFLWPLIITNSVGSRPLTVGLQVFSATDQGIDWSIITAATLLTTAPLLIAFLLFQRQFVQSFMRAGIRCSAVAGRTRGGWPPVTSPGSILNVPTGNSLPVETCLIATSLLPGCAKLLRRDGRGDELGLHHRRRRLAAEQSPGRRPAPPRPTPGSRCPRRHRAADWERPWPASSAAPSCRP